MMSIQKLYTAGLIIVKENKLLLAYSKNKKAWYLPGGKLDKGETSLQAIKREISEELSIDLEDNRLKFYIRVNVPAYGERKGVMMVQDCYLYELVEEIKPGKEIGSVKFFDEHSYLEENEIVPGVIKAFENLHRDGILTK